MGRRSTSVGGRVPLYGQLSPTRRRQTASWRSRSTPRRERARRRRRRARSRRRSSRRSPSRAPVARRPSPACPAVAPRTASASSEDQERRGARARQASPPWPSCAAVGLLGVAGVHDPLAEVLRVVDADEAEPVGRLVAGGVEVDRADLHDPVDRRLLDRDVLDAVDVRGALRLREDPAADVEALRRDRVLREEPVRSSRPRS